MVEKLLLNVRIQKDIDEIIRMATETMGYSLTTTNRIWVELLDIGVAMYYGGVLYVKEK